VVRVKGRPDVPFVHRRSRHGPVISDAGTMNDVLGSGAAAGRPGFVLAMRWTALDEDSDPIGAGLALQAARDVGGFFAAVQGLVAPMQNMVVADRAGRIAMISPGRVPLRGPGHDLQGRVPAPGWEPRYDWSGFIPPDQTPRQRDPARGWIASANQRIVGPDYPYHLTHEWALPYRQQRIEQLLEARPRHTLAELAVMQMDQRSLAVKPLLPALRKAESAHPLAAAAKAQLEGFDGDMDAARAAPLISWAWQRQLARGVFADDVGEALWDKALAGRSFQDALENVLARDDQGWCDDRTTPAPETCALQSGAALTRALDELSARFGADPARWRWGDAHVARSEHRPFSRVAGLQKLFELRTPVGGDTHTVKAMRVGLRPDKLTGDLYHVDHSASLRAVYDVARRENSGVVHSGGQSGIVFSRHYRDFVGPWTRGELLPLWPQGAPAAVLVLKPAKTPAQSTP
jgi:penicillin G amidase